MIDTHFHLMQSDDPGNGTGLDSYVAVMDAFGITSAITVQPSTHKFDTDITLSATERHPDRFKAVAVVPTEIELPQLLALKKRGTVGIRINMISNPDQATLPKADFLKKVRDAGLFLQVFSSGETLARVVELSAKSEVHLVIDHLGKPDPLRGLNQLGFREMLTGAKEGWLSIKLSGPFRMEEPWETYQTATEFAKFALKEVPLSQFIAGTDWPFIHLDRKPTMKSVFTWLKELLPDESDWNTVCTENARKLCHPD